MNVSLVTALWSLDSLPSAELPKFASEALSAGYDSPSLRILAGEISPAMSDAAPLFLRALQEIGVTIPSHVEAGKIVAAHLARDVVSGKISPYQGARRIWWDVYNEIEELQELVVFVGLASQFEDYEESARTGDSRYVELISEIEKEIVLEAKSLSEKYSAFLSPAKHNESLDGTAK